MTHNCTELVLIAQNSLKATVAWTMHFMFKTLKLKKISILHLQGLENWRKLSNVLKIPATHQFFFFVLEDCIIVECEIPDHLVIPSCRLINNQTIFKRTKNNVWINLTGQYTQRIYV